jgi:excinuclease ABC subunit B
MERAMEETSRRREKQTEYNLANGITPESIKSHISDILNSVYEKDHVRADISGFAREGALVGNNLRTHLEHLERKMRDAAADLDFETAARLRDEIKRLQATELAIADDPLAREVESEGLGGRRKRGGRDRVISPPVGEMAGRPEGSAKERNAKSLFAKPHLDEMGASGDHATPAGATSRSLFKKQSHREAHGSDYGTPDDGGKSLFRKNTLDEMTVRRTEKPAEGVRPVKRERAGIGSYEEPADVRREKRRPGKTGRPGR